jgi:hypothetical protein
MFNAHGKLEVTDFYGKRISYGGVAFDGSPRQVFWTNHFEPFIYDTGKKLFHWIITHCNTHNLDPTQYLAEGRGLARALVEHTYAQMLQTDQLLRGGGFPNSVTRVSVDDKVRAMHSRLDDLLLALTHVGRPANPGAAKSSVLKLEPNFHGIGFSLPALWKRIRDVLNSWRFHREGRRVPDAACRPQGIKNHVCERGRLGRVREARCRLGWLPKASRATKPSAQVARCRRVLQKRITRFINGQALKRRYPRSPCYRGGAAGASCHLDFGTIFGSAGSPR